MNPVRIGVQIGLLLMILLPFGVVAQTPQAPAFAEYPAVTAAYLKRLHNPGQGGAPFAFRDDYPGGFTGWQEAARGQLRCLLGLDVMEETLAGHQPSVTWEPWQQEDGYRRRRGTIETEPGIRIPFWLLRPEGQAGEAAGRPLAICSHGHDRDGWNTYAGVYRDADHRASTLAKSGDIGVQAVRRGFITLVPATRGLAEAVSIPDLKGRHGNRTCRAQLIHCLLAGRTAVGERVWDTQHLLDWALRHVDGVDPHRVLMTGNSGGGVLTVYVAALDERIHVAVPSCSFTSYTSAAGFVFHCDCCLVPRAQRQMGDMADIGALTAPRYLLAVHGRTDGLHSQPDVEAAMRRVATVYRAGDAGTHFRFAWGAAGHRFYPEIMWPFIESALRRKKQ
ncbi:MAG: hypothetical protein CL681_01275 [Blastopirellula sp.]|nr:hypothetical protein [Blastopirellula sp.]